MINNTFELRLYIFLALLFLMFTLEILWPKKLPVTNKYVRAANNMSIFTLNVALTKILLPSALLVSALWAKKHNIGILNLIEMPAVVKLTLAVFALDLTLYFQHRLFHMTPALWRVHKVHHADIDFDCTTSVRFHSIEIIISIILRCLLIAILGVSPETALAFEIVLNAALTFNHSNIRITDKLDYYLRLLIVTPNMHRIHHSIDISEYNSNYGPIFSCWDYLFKTCTFHPKTSYDKMEVGITDPGHTSKADNVLAMLQMPFSKTSGH